MPFVLHPVHPDISKSVPLLFPAMERERIAVTKSATLAQSKLKIARERSRLGFLKTSSYT